MSTAAPTLSRQERADRLKERIYLTFTALAVVLALRVHHDVDGARALLTLMVTLMGTLAAVFTADIVSHFVVHERTMHLAEYRRAVRSSFGTIGAVTVPIVFLVLAAMGVWPTSHALRAATIALITTLVIIGWAAVRRVPLSWPQRLLALAGEAALGLAVVWLQTFAHG